MAIGEVFYGNALSVIDAKSRASLPAKLRATVEKRALRAQEPNQPPPERSILLCQHPRHLCLQGFDQGYEEVLLAKLQERVARMDDVDPIDADDDEQVEGFGTVTEVGYDPSGRFVLPTPLRKVAGLDLNGVAVFVGAGETFQIWHPDRFRAAFHDKPRLINVLDGLLEERKGTRQ